MILPSCALVSPGKCCAQDSALLSSVVEDGAMAWTAAALLLQMAVAAMRRLGVGVFAGTFTYARERLH